MLLHEGMDDNIVPLTLAVEGSPNKPAPWPSPTSEMLRDPVFEVIWQRIKTWDINVPEVYCGHCGANGNHVRAILDAIQDYVKSPDKKVS